MTDEELLEDIAVLAARLELLMAGIDPDAEEDDAPEPEDPREETA